MDSFSGGLGGRLRLPRLVSPSVAKERGEEKWVVCTDACAPFLCRDLGGSRGGERETGEDTKESEAACELI